MNDHSDPPGNTDASKHSRPDPTSMLNQPALRTSTGKIWLVMGAFFVVASLIPLGALIFVRQGPSAPLATVIACGVIGLYLVMIAVRISVKNRTLRLRILAACMLAIAALALLGMLACMLIERSATL